MSSSSSSPPSYASAVGIVKDEKSSSRTRDGDGSPVRKSEGRKEDVDLPRRRARHSRQLSENDIQQLSAQIRSSKNFDAEFLRKLAKQGGLPDEYNGKELPKFRVITGSEAAEVYNNAIREDDHRSTTSHDRSRGARVFDQRPVVFAYPGIRAGRKVVDFYMSWKGKTKAHRLKGAGRRSDILDEEFKKVIKTFDKDHKRLSKMSTSTDEIPLLPKSTVGSSRPPTVVQTESAPAVLTTTNLAESDPKRPPLSSRESNTSVVSLPYLDALGAGPSETRVPLRIVNPDPASSSTSSDSRRSSLVNNNGKSSKGETGSPRTSGNKLSIVEEEAETTSTKEHHSKHSKHRHRSSEPSSTPSSSSESLPSYRGKNDNSDEILIVLLDDKKAWHGLTGRRDSTKSVASLARKPSQRVSPWSGPIAYSQGEIHRYLPGAVIEQDAVFETDLSSSESDDSDSDDDDDDSDSYPNQAVVPLRRAFSGMGMHSSAPPTRAPTPASHLVSSPPAAIYANTPAAPSYIHPSPAGTHVASLQSPYPVSVLNLPPRTSTPLSHTAVPAAIYSGVTGASPYIHSTPLGAHPASLHQSPYSMSAPNLPDNTPYVFPWISDDHNMAAAAMSPAQNQSRQATWMTPAAVYSSPYVPAAQLPYPYGNTPASQAAPPSLYASTPYTGASVHQSLPPISTYVSPYMEASQQPLPPSTYPSPYVRAHTPNYL